MVAQVGLFTLLCLSSAAAFFTSSFLGGVGRSQHVLQEARFVLTSKTRCCVHLVSAVGSIRCCDSVWRYDSIFILLVAHEVLLVRLLLHSLQLLVGAGTRLAARIFLCNYGCEQTDVSPSCIP